MKMSILASGFLLASLTVSSAFAGFNGSYLHCVSSSGKTILKSGQIGSVGYESIQLSIEGRAVEFINGADYQIDQVQTVTMVRDNNTQTIPLVLEQVAATKQQIAKGQTVQVRIHGTDPRTGKALTSPISLGCKSVDNPI